MRRHMHERGRIPARRLAEREQGLCLGGQKQASGMLRPYQRFDAEAVARRDEAPPASVPDQEREFAAQVVDKGVAVLLVQVYGDLAVAAGSEPVSARNEPAAKGHGLEEFSRMEA